MRFIGFRYMLVKAFGISSPWDIIKETLGEIDGRTIFQLTRGKNILKVRFSE